MYSVSALQKLYPKSFMQLYIHLYLPSNGSIEKKEKYVTLWLFISLWYRQDG